MKIKYEISINNGEYVTSYNIDIPDDEITMEIDEEEAIIYITECIQNDFLQKTTWGFNCNKVKADVIELFNIEDTK